MGVSRFFPQNRFYPLAGRQDQDSDNTWRRGVTVGENLRFRLDLKNLFGRSTGLFQLKIRIRRAYTSFSVVTMSRSTSESLPAEREQPAPRVFPDSPYRLYQAFEPAGDQPEAI